jgi:hypothetical protein
VWRGRTAVVVDHPLSASITMWKQALRAVGLFEPLKRAYRAVRPVPAPATVAANIDASVPVDPYNAWLAARQATRAAEYRPRPRKTGSGPQTPTFSILTTVYHGTPGPLFDETVRAVLAQTHDDFEWLVLAHGPVSAEVERRLRKLESDRRARVLREPVNLGIVGGMRLCLDSARGRYIVPLDADDLLPADALRVLAHTIEVEGEPAFLYSDEDLFVDGRHAHPYLRPDWDPVLNLANSFVWHLCAFRRDRALELGVYSDRGCEYCHDWDSITRFALAGHAPVHVREILYHWRAHAGSSTNNADPNKGSLASQRHLLQRVISAQPHSERYEVREFPIFRGALEWGIARRPVDPPAVTLLVPALEGDSPETASAHLDTITSKCDFPFAHRLHTTANLADVSATLLRTTTEFTVVCSTGVTPENAAGLWEAIRLLEFHPDLAVVAGRILNPDSFVVGGGELFGFEGLSGCPEYARVPHDPGPWAFFLKQRCVDAPNPHFLVARTSFLRSACATVPTQASFPALGLWLGGHAAQRHERVATSPLVVSRARPFLDVRHTPAGEERAALLVRHGERLTTSRWYNPALGTTSADAYQFRAA